MINSTKISGEFKEKIRKSVPSDFDLTQIGKIDLKEAEKIAREEVIFLKEEDLIEGLEGFELIPLKDITSIPDEELVSKPPERGKKTSIAEVSEPITESIGEEMLDFDDIQHETDIPDILSADKPDTSFISESDAEIIPSPDLNKVDHPEGWKQKNIAVQINTEPEVELTAHAEAADKSQEKEKNTPSANFQEEPDSTYSAENYQQIPDLAEIDEIFEDEVLPDRYSDITKKSNVSFIDDGRISKERDFSITSEDDQLTSRLSKMIDITKGKLRIIESDPDLFSNRYTLEEQKIYEYDDEVFYEEKFLTDTDFDFIDNSIIKEDFIHYIQEIDEYYSTEAKYSQSEISEIMGFAHDEEKYFEELLFGDYYKDIDIDSEIEFINPGLDFFSRSTSDKKDMMYLLDDPESLKDDEKHSIEADISSDSAIVFEESVKDIKSMLGEASDHVVVEKEYMQVSKPAETRAEPEQVIFEDITDKVIILDDLENMNDFMETLPDKKEDLTKLLAYLDGLFEKLPEETLRKFAESEYFDLYAKVLKDMGI